MKLEVPEGHIEPFRELILLGPKTRNALLEALAEAPPTLMIRELAASVASATRLEEAKVARHLGVLAGLYRTRVSAEESIQQFVEDVCETGRGLFETDEAAQQVDWDSFRGHLAVALRMDEPLGVASKAVEIAVSYERLFAEGKVLTDIRPVFPPEPEKRPLAAMIVHNLKISYYEEGRQKETYFALDSEDLKLLQKELRRAEAKEGTLKAFLSEAKITWLKPEAIENGNS